MPAFAVRFPRYRAELPGPCTGSCYGSKPGSHRRRDRHASECWNRCKRGTQSGENGLYLFDLVDPGTYTLIRGEFRVSKFVQENILVQMRGDITVNALLKPGSVQESVTVTEAPVSVQFNSSNKDLTLDSQMAAETPRIDRNPFKLTLLAPSATNTRGEMMPYHSWAANSVDLGGGTNLKNDLQVDGSPIGMGHKNSYTPNTDAVQEVVVSTNSVDAESGHSAGGLISMTMKSGTNDWHGTGFYLGRYPWLNAAGGPHPVHQNATRQHMYGRHARATRSSRTSSSISSHWNTGKSDIRNSFVTHRADRR